MGEALEKAMQKLNKDLGEGVVMRGGSVPLKVDAIPTGSLSLDSIIGVGGIPRGRITEAFGREGAGKSTLMFHVIASGQKMGFNCALIDVEHALDRKYAEAIGVNFDDLILSQPESAEQAIDVCEALVRTGEIGVVVIDSVAALAPRAELEGDAGDMNIGLQARLMGQMMRKIKGAVHATNTACCFINQLRDKPGAWSPNGQVVEVTPGGRALKFQASLRIDMRKMEDIKDGKENIGIRARVKTVKNKVAPPLRECVIDILYGIGIDSVSDTLSIGIDKGVILKGGSWLTYGQTRWHGREDALLSLRGNAELLAEIDREIRKVM